MAGQISGLFQELKTLHKRWRQHFEIKNFYTGRKTILRAVSQLGADKSQDPMDIWKNRFHLLT